MKVLCLLMITIALSSCSFVGSMGYVLQERDYVVENPAYPPFQWAKVELPQASSIYEEAESIKGLSSLLVVKEGFLVAEWYAPAFQPEQAVNIKSVSKSVMSALVGIAIREGYLRGLDQPLYEILPEFFPPNEPKKQTITIRHLLTMSAGFEYRENRDNHVYAASNWTRSILQLPLQDVPGQSFNYGTIQTHLLSAAITKTSGMSTLEFAQKYLFDPMHISIHQWKKSPDGVFFGGSQMYLTPRDMAAFGRLYLDYGRFQGQQLVPEEWVKQSTKPVFRDARDGISYGYGWWVKQLAGYEVYFAEGYGNQTIMNIPDLDAVIVLAADTPYFFDYDKRSQMIQELLTRDIIPLLSH